MILQRLALIALAGWFAAPALADDADAGRAPVEAQPAAVAVLTAPASSDRIRKDGLAAAPATEATPADYADDEFERYDGSALQQWWVRYGATLRRAE
jgi:hypothetical protein